MSANTNNEQIDSDNNESYFYKVLASFSEYENEASKVIAKKERDFANLPERHKNLLSSCKASDSENWCNCLPKRIDASKECIKANARFLEAIVSTVGTELVPGSAARDPNELSEREMVTAAKRRISPADMEKVESTLRQFVRDWSENGQPERSQTYGPVLETLERHFANVPLNQRGSIRVLVPGAGLGRLAYEIARAGFSAQGNEFSFPMLFASNFVLNNVTEPLAFTIYPYVHSWSNLITAADQLLAVGIPDTVAHDIPPTSDFSMVAGDFLEVYRDHEEHKRQWDVVVTCFFIDTAHNVCDYVETIERVLKRGGLWINIGPLLYHYENASQESSIEPTFEELKQIILAHGFEFLEEQRNIPVAYASHPNLMLRHIYNVVFFVCKI